MAHAQRNYADTTTRQMIDAYIGAGLHKRLPVTDARLLPMKPRLDWESLTPGASAQKVYSSIRTTKDRAPVAHESWPPLSSVVEKLGPCPSQPGSVRSGRFEIMAAGLTLEVLKSRGLRLSDLTRYIQTGAVVLRIPEVPA